MSRLELSLLKSYDRGIHTFRLRTFFQNLRTQIDEINLEDLKPREQDLIKGHPHWHQLSDSQKQITLAQLHREYIRSQDVFPLYQALLEDTSESSSEILEALSDEQFKRIIDLDIWHDGEMSIENAMRWLNRYATLSSRHLYERFISLDQEHQLAIACQLICGYSPEDVESLDEEKKSSLLSFPQEAYYYDIRATDHKVIATAIALMEALQEHHMEYALALVSHGRWQTPLENQNLAWQFSQARREELGFVPQQRAQKSFVFSKQQQRDFHTKVKLLLASDPIHHQLPSGDDSHTNPITPEDRADRDTTPFLFSLLHHLDLMGLWQKQDWSALMNDWTMCANHLASAMGLQPSKFSEREFLFEHIFAAHSLALDLMSSHNPARAALLLPELSVKSCLCYMRSELAPIRSQAAGILTKCGLVPAHFEFFVETSRYGLIQNSLDQCQNFYGLHHVELLKGFFNRFILAADQPDYSSKNTSQKTEPLYHTAITNASQLRHHLIEISALLWITELVHFADHIHHKTPLAHKASLDTLWLKSLANVVLTHRFIPRRFESHHITELASVDSELIHNRLSEFKKNMPSVTTHPMFVKLISHITQSTDHPMEHMNGQTHSQPSVIAQMIDDRCQKHAGEYSSWLLDIRSNSSHILLSS